MPNGKISVETLKRLRELEDRITSRAPQAPERCPEDGLPCEWDYDTPLNGYRGPSVCRKCRRPAIGKNSYWCQ